MIIFNHLTNLTSASTVSLTTFVYFLV